MTHEDFDLPAYAVMNTEQVWFVRDGMFGQMLWQGEAEALEVAAQEDHFEVVKVSSTNP